MRAEGAASTPGLHWPPEKPTATTPRSCGWERNLECTIEVNLSDGAGEEEPLLATVPVVLEGGAATSSAREGAIVQSVGV